MPLAAMEEMVQQAGLEALRLAARAELAGMRFQTPRTPWMGMLEGMEAAPLQMVDRGAMAAAVEMAGLLVFRMGRRSRH